MNPVNRIIDLARAASRRIVLAEGADPRVIDAAIRADRDGLARIALVGPASQIADAIVQRGGDPARFAIEDPQTSPLTGPFADAYLEMRRHKGVDAMKARAAVSDAVGFAGMLLREGHADGMIAGAVVTTAHTIRTAFQIIGRAPGVNTVSSFFLMIMNEPHHVREGTFVFADCALVVEPTAEELADIAIAAAQNYTAIMEEEARVAMLSFSTMGSASHERVRKVAEATNLVRAARPDLKVDGEMQFDAAFVPAVNKSKAPGSVTGGEANVFIFPNLESANIGYKIAQRIGNAIAIGPVLQGLAKPVNDLSRGCSADDIYSLIAVTSLQAASSTPKS
ncbi:MAG: phosphate acetyltransferase [Rhodomicrobiaceae bacterium]